MFWHYLNKTLMELNWDCWLEQKSKLANVSRNPAETSGEDRIFHWIKLFNDLLITRRAQKSAVLKQQHFQTPQIRSSVVCAWRSYKPYIWACDLESPCPVKAAASLEQPGSIFGSPRETRRGKSRRHFGLVFRVQIILSLMNNEH